MDCFNAAGLSGGSNPAAGPLFATPATIIPATILVLLALFGVDPELLAFDKGQLKLGDGIDILVLAALGFEMFKSSKTDGAAAANNVLSAGLAFAFLGEMFLIPALWNVFAAKALLALMIDA